MRLFSGPEFELLGPTSAGQGSGITLCRKGGRKNGGHPLDAQPGAGNCKAQQENKKSAPLVFIGTGR